MLDRYGPADHTDVGPAARDAHLRPLEEHLAERSAEDAWVADLLATPPPSASDCGPFPCGRHDGPTGPHIAPTPPAWLTEDLAPGDDDAGVPEWVGLLDDPDAGAAIDAAQAVGVTGASAPVDAAGAAALADGSGTAADQPALTHLVQHDPDRARRIVAGMAPGAALALFLQTVDLRDVDDATLVELVAGATRLGSWAHAITTRAAAELADRPAMNPLWPADIPTPARPGAAAEEVAMRLACSTRSAQSLIDQGQAFAGPMWPTGDALADGSISPTASRMLVDRLATLDPELTVEVQEAVLPAAPRRTPTQLRHDVERALIDLDPAGAEGRARRARRGRCLHRPRPLLDGMASLTAVLPTTTAVEMYATLDHAAHHARRSGDPRTLDQLRADHLYHWVTTSPDPTMLTTSASSPAHGTLSVSGTTPASGGLPASRPPTAPSGGLPATGTGVGPAAGAGLGPAAGAGWGPVGAEERLSALSPHGAAAGPAPSGATAGAQPPPRGMDEPPGPAVASDSTSRRPRQADIRVHVALSTLLGLDERPAEIAGYGPVDAAQARSLAVGGTWRRIVTDPLSGAVLDVGRTRYRPPQDLVDHIEERDRCCARPGCTRPARSCDLDHTIAFGPVSGSGGSGARRDDDGTRHDGDGTRREDGRTQPGRADALPHPGDTQDGGIDPRLGDSGSQRDTADDHDDQSGERSDVGQVWLDRDGDRARPGRATTISGAAGARRYHPELAALLAREAAQDPDDPAVLHARAHADALGSTSATNLGPLCRRDHLLKTHAGYRLRQTSAGQFEWITPTGHRYRDIPGAGGSSAHDGVIPF